MPRYAPLLVVALVWSLPLSFLQAEVQFVSRPLPVIKDMAARQGKLFFVHFTAQWCMPCRWMEENTFSDPDLARYVEANYIAVKMDIDNAYGLQCKDEYGVKVLPTILVFNAAGEILDRREASVAPELLLDLLQRHRRAQPVTLPAHAAAAPDYPQAPKATMERLSPGTIYRPALLPDQPTAPIQQPAAYTGNSNFHTPGQPGPAIQQPAVITPVSYHSAPVAHGGPESGEGMVVFTVQTGVFSDYGNALNEVTRLENLLRRPVNLVATPQQGKPLYKITVGSFSSRQTAENYAGYLRGRSIPGFVRTAGER